MKSPFFKYGNLLVLFEMVGDEQDQQEIVGLHEISSYGESDLTAVLKTGYRESVVRDDSSILFSFEKNGKLELVEIERDRIASLLNFVKQQYIENELMKRKN